MYSAHSASSSLGSYVFVHNQALSSIKVPKADPGISTRTVSVLSSFLPLRRRPTVFIESQKVSSITHRSNAAKQFQALDPFSSETAAQP